MKIRLNSSNSNSCHGIALVLVMMTIVVLSAIVGSLAIAMSTEMRLARNTDYSDQMEWMGRSGIELARYALANKCSEQKQIDALNQFWAGGTSPCSNGVESFPLKNVPLGPGEITVTITDMERKWDINLVANPQAPQKEVLQKALTEVGVTDAEQQSEIIDSIIDWINPGNSAGFSGAKSDYYLHQNPPYYCKSGIIDDISELLLIKGITPEIYWGSNSTNHPISAYQQHTGAFNQPVSSSGAGFHDKDLPLYPVGLVELFGAMGGKLNVNTASIKTLQLIPGIDQATAEQIIQQRAGPDGVDGTDDDVPLTSPGQINGGLPGGGGFGGNVRGAPQAGLAAQGLAAYVAVQSLVFEVKIDAVIGDYKRTFYGIVSRSPQGNQLQCVKFYWE